MKRPEERRTPGRKALYDKPVRSSFIIPQAILDALEQSDVPGSTRNQKLVNALAEALQVRGFPASA